jgi:cobalt/nickel transport system permease protein
MIQEPFANGNSPIHRIDPRFKIVVATAYSFAIALSNELPALIIAFLISISLIVAAGLNAWQVFKRLSVVMGFLLLLWAILPITYEGETLFRIGPLAMTEPGVKLSALITIKSITILMIIIALTATMTTATFGHALNRLGVPEKIVHLFLMTYRYIFVLEQEFQKLLTATKIRGFRPSTNMHSYKTYAYLIGMLFVRASERSQRVYLAMLCRGFKGRFYTLLDFPPSRRNWIFLTFMSILLFCLIVLELNIFNIGR